MRTFMTICLSFLCTCSVFSQGQFPVDMEAVKEAVSDKNAETYYPNLLKRYLDFDESLTLDDYRLIYYGFILQDSYNGYEDTRTEEINNLKDKGKYKAALKINDEVLERMPVSLDMNFEKIVILDLINPDDPLIEKYIIRFRMLARVIYESGDGLTCETGFKVLYIGDEYTFMYVFLEIEKHFTQNLVDHCDLFTIKPTEDFQESELFFDASSILESFSKIWKK